MKFLGRNFTFILIFLFIIFIISVDGTISQGKNSSKIILKTNASIPYPKEDYIYKIMPANLSKENAISLASQYGLNSGDLVKEHEKGQNYLFFQNEDKTLLIDKITGGTVYFDYGLIKEKKPEEVKVPSDDEAIKIAKDKVGSIAGGSAEVYQINQATSTNYSLELNEMVGTYTTLKEVLFRKKIDNRWVVGDSSMNASVFIGDKGTIVGSTKDWQSPKKFKKVYIMSPKEALKKYERISNKNKSMTTIEINKITYGYDAITKSNGVKLIYPVYILLADVNTGQDIYENKVVTINAVKNYPIL